MLRVDPNLRPSCSQILELDPTKLKAKELGINIEDDGMTS